MKVTDFPMLLVEDDPEEIVRVQEALAQASLVNPLRIVNDGRKAIAYLSGQEEYADRASHPFPSLVLLDLTLPETSGWEVLAHLHNHSFLFDRKVGDKMWTTEESKEDIGGGISPSRTDVSFYLSSRAELKLRGVWVSNGFDTLHLRSEELDRLRAAD